MAPRYYAGATMKIALLAVSLAAALAMPAHAGRPLTTEDASILEDRACQLEAWVDRSRAATEAWAAPACSFAGIEWQAGAARSREEGRGRFAHAYAQAKAAFVSVDDSPWGVGLVLGITREALREARNGWSDPYAIVPVSFRLGEGGALLHLSAGATRDRTEHRHVANWGIAIEAPVGKSGFTALAEAFGEKARDPFVRVGARWSAIAEVLDLDLSYVTRVNGERSERYLSLGLYYKADSLLP